MSTDKKASNFIIPYPVQENSDGTIVFTTDAGITYQVGFVDASYHFEGVQLAGSQVFELSFYPIGSTGRLPQDIRVGLTIIYLLQIFFLDHENVLLYVCESLDRKHHARKRKFDTWFNQFGTADFEKFDYSFVVEDDSILVSAILSKQNSQRDELVRAFETAYSFYDGLK